MKYQNMVNKLLFLLIGFVVLSSNVILTADRFPIKGTIKADTIRVKSYSSSSKTVKVEINGKTKIYKWENSYKDRVIKGREGNDKITIEIAERFVIYGGMGNDDIRGGSKDDVIYGEEGKDVIRGNNGHDWIKAGAGNDKVYGGDGNDIIYGNAGKDYLNGGEGNDLIDGGDGGDEIHGSSGNDMLYGENGQDKIKGGTGDDLIRGGAQKDIIAGNGGKDYLLGEGGKDIIQDSSALSESSYENKRKKRMKDIEKTYGVAIKDFGRKWTLMELGYLDKILGKLPSKVLKMWKGIPGKLTYNRKELCKLIGPGYNEFSITGLKSIAIYIYDPVWRKSTSKLKKEYIKTICHETGHSFQFSLAMSKWKDFKALSGWNGNPNKKARFVSSYAEKNAREDWAESFAYYFVDPFKLCEKAEAKFEFLNDMFDLYRYKKSTTTGKCKIAKKK